MLGVEDFGTSLRRFRLAAGLTQERLAERSGISANGVAALEAGRRKSPRLHTVGLLSTALNLTDEQRAQLFAMATAASAGDSVGGSAGDSAGGSAATSAERKPSRVESTSTGFVGRESELQKLHSAWTKRTGLVLLSGEAGVGKSTLADEFASQLTTRNVTIWRGRSTSEQLGAYEAFIDPIRVALQDFDGKVPTSLRDLGRIVPGLLEYGNDALDRSRTDPTVDRRLLFETVRELIAGVGPLLLLLDDIHWADAGSLALLGFLVSQPTLDNRTALDNLMVLGTVRSTDVSQFTSAKLSELRRHCSMSTITLDGLRDSELEQLITDVAGVHISPTMVSTVSDATNGNPLYVKELTEHLVQRGFDTSSDLPFVPEGIRHTIAARIVGLSPSAQLLLRAGSVLGSQFLADVAGDVAGISGEDLLSATEDALLSGTITEQSATTLAFSHGLVASTVYEAMSKSRRLGLHRSAAIALAAQNPTSAAEIVSIARHWMLVVQSDHTVRSTAAQWLARAGDAAAKSAAVDEAITYYRQAEQLWLNGGGDSTSERADTLARLGAALLSTGEVNEGKRFLQQAFDGAEAAANPTVFARAALGLAASVRYQAVDHEIIAQLELAIGKLGPSEMIWRPALLATLKRQLGFVDTPEAAVRRAEATAIVNEAVTASDVSDDLLISLGSLRDSLIIDDPIPLGEFARRIVAAAAARQDLSVLSSAWYRQAWSALELGDAQLFRTAVDEYRTIAGQLKRPYELAMSSNMLAAVAQIEGRHDDAETFGREALTHAATIEDGNFSWVYFSNSGLRAFDNGLANQNLEVMLAVRSDFGGNATFEAALAATAATCGNHVLANQLIEEQVGINGETLDRNWSYLSAERLPVVGFLAWACTITGNIPYAYELRERLARIAELGVKVVRVAPVGAWIGPVAHHLGALSRVVGEFSVARQYLGEALAVEDEMNGQPFKVRTLLELALVSELDGGPNSVEVATGLRGDATALAQRLGLNILAL